ncbi:MAG: hypothetical protein Q8K58_05005 [Acidimicrobiales bacterium]|nr:hypothetical protein [Acidimicrobiales bacterium]
MGGRGPGEPDGLGHVVERHGLDEVDLRLRQRRDLCAVVVLGFVDGDVVVRLVRVATRTDEPGHLHRRQLPGCTGDVQREEERSGHGRESAAPPGPALAGQGHRAPGLLSVVLLST